VHDRVHETAVRLFSPEKNHEAHQAFGHYLLAGLAEPEPADLYRIATHLMAGTPDVDPEATYDLCIRAGNTAKIGFDHDEAYRFYSFAESLAEKHKFDMASFIENHAESANAVGRKDEAIKRLQTAIALAPTGIDR